MRKHGRVPAKLAHALSYYLSVKILFIWVTVTC
jgi:hypothetical protein